MSCQLSLLANFQDINLVRNYLFPHLKQDITSGATEGWDDSDWGWKDDEEPQAAKENTTTDPQSLSWLQECQISLSPAADLMAIACDERLVLLGQKWNSSQDDVQISYQIVFQGCMKQEEGENINSILCLPLASQKRSTQGGPDWTCVIVGFSSGYVRMYTENGALLLSQIFSLEPVQKLKCRTYQPPRHVADAEKHEELSILYIKSLVTIDGFSLFQSLRACRNQVARAAASGSDFIQPPPLAYKKWGLHEQDVVVDHVSCGLQTPNPFDQMHMASMIGGYTATIRSTPPASHLYVTAGLGPYTGFFHAVEGSAQPILSDVAHAVASKLKTALFSQISVASGWLGFGGKAVPEYLEKKKPKIELATTLPSRFGLHDKRREGVSLVLSPDNKMAAVTDSFGRVMLVDVWRGIALRMWKGYRDAQVGWIDVKEDLHHDVHGSNMVARHAIFLAIYAPKRGILEVWASQHGPRVAAFNVSKWCCMICPTHGMMGLNNVTYKDIRVQLHHIYMVDPEGCIKTIDVPFHLVLSDKNSKRARDMHLLKKLKIALKDHNTEGAALESEVIDTLLDIKIASIRQQGLERVLQMKYLSPSFLLTVNRAVSKQLQGLASGCADREEETLDYESRALLQFCYAQEHLLNTYIALLAINNNIEDILAVKPKPKNACQLLSLTPEEHDQMVSALDAYHAVNRDKVSVTFQEDQELTVNEFLSCFECQMLRHDPVDGATSSLGGTNKSISNDMCGSTESLGSSSSNHLRVSTSDGNLMSSSSLFDRSSPVSHIDGNSGSANHISSLGGSTIRVQLQPGLHESRLTRLANFLFRFSLKHGTTSDYNISLKESHIPPENLMTLLLHLWLGEDRKSLDDMLQLNSIVKSITCLNSYSVLVTDHSKISPWWYTLRQSCCQATNISSALIAVVVGRNVAMEMAKCSMKDNLLSDWEAVSIDRTQWTLLIKQLEDLLAVQCLLHMKPTNDKLVCKPAWEPEPIIVSVKKVLDGGRGVLPEFVAKWIAGQGILPSMLCLSQSSTEKHEVESIERCKDSSKKHVLTLATENPIIRQLQEVQRRLPHSMDTDILMANCAWEYIVLWNKDPEVMFPMIQALAYLKCIQNAVMQHGIATMMWQMFVVKKLSSAALLMEKVGKAPKDRLCRKEVGLSDASLNKFMKMTVELLEIIQLAIADSKEVAMLNVEDLWQHVQGPTSLAELALEQKRTNLELLEHHLSLCVILHATLNFSMKSIKPLSLFDTKGRNAFFNPLQSTPILACRVVDEALATGRKQFLYRVISHAVQMLGTTDNPPSPLPPSPIPGSGPPSPQMFQGRVNSLYVRWPLLIYKIAMDLCVDLEELRRHHTCELYSSGLELMAEEVLLTIVDHAVIGSQILLISGQRLAHFILVCDPPGSVERLSKCSTSVSTWIQTLDPSQLRCANVPLKDTATLIGHAVSYLPEDHPEYNTAVELLELVNCFL